MTMKFSLSIIPGIALAVLFGSVSGQFDFEDISPQATVFETTSLPTDNDGNFLPRYQASVGNGHVSTTVYTDTVYMNGLYNGERGESHRARIPSRNNIRVTQAESDVVANHVFGLDVAKGYFYEKFTIITTNGTTTVEQRTFAHRYYNKVLVTQIIFNATGTNSETQVFLSSDSGAPSVDVTFGPERPFNSQYVSDATVQCGQTNDLEDTTYQSAKLNACVVSTAMPTSIQYNPTGSKSVVNFFAAYDFVEADAAADFEAVAKLDSEGSEDIFNSHANAWAEVWEEGAIEVEGNTDLSKVIYGSLYYILSSLPVTTPTNTPVRQFYGLSPGGLAYGDKLMDYQGHSFWDTETWMYPTFAYMFPKTAQEILNYRLSVLQAARDRANETGYKGSRFPWEAAVTGREVTPDCCPETRDLQIHITGDISYAVRQYIAITRDLDWLKVTKPGYIANGCTMVREMAEFWASRAEFNPATGLHDILGVMPPDEDNHGVDNNPYTNIGAGYAIFFAKYAECLCSGDMQAIPDEWLTIAKSLALLYDAEHDYHPEFDGYVFGTPIKQADVVLIGFPQLYNMAASTRRNDLLIYENVTREDGPAMTWAMHTIGFLELDDTELAESIFNKSYQSYMRQPYKIWTEARPPTLGAINFITGMGGFLQSIVSGYGGYRLYPEKIVFQKPRVPPQTTGLKIKGLDYLENSFDLYVTSTSVIFTLQKTTGKFPLIIERDGEQFPFTTIGGSVMFQQTASNPIPELTMYGTSGTQCELPLDKIGEPVAQKTYQKHTKKA